MSVFSLLAAASADVPDRLDPVRLFLDADIVVQLVMAGLLLASGRGQEAVSVHRTKFERRTLRQDYARLREHFDEGQLVELGFCCALFCGFARLVASWDLSEDLPPSFRAAGEVTPWGHDDYVALDPSLVQQAPARA